MTGPAWRPALSLAPAVLFSVAAPAPALSPSGFVRLAEHGLRASFEATYQASGDLAPFPGPTWTVVVAGLGHRPRHRLIQRWLQLVRWCAPASIYNVASWENVRRRRRS